MVLVLFKNVDTDTSATSFLKSWSNIDTINSLRVELNLKMMQIAEVERAQEQMNLMPGGGGSDQYHHHQAANYEDARNNFLPVNLLEPNPHYSRRPDEDQTPLRLVYASLPSS